MTTIYLAGPINNCTDAEVYDWRDDMSQRLRGHTILSPLARDYRGKEDENVEDIVEGDKADILNSRVMIAFCPKPSVGTSMEVLYAWQTPNVRVVVYVPPGAPVSPWLKFHCDRFVDSAEGAVVAVNSLL